MNVLNYWVIPTIKALPETYEVLLDAVRTAMLDLAGHNDFKTFPNGPSSSGRESYVHAAYLHLLKIGRKEAFWDVLEEGCEEVRCQGRVAVRVAYPPMCGRSSRLSRFAKGSKSFLVLLENFHSNNKQIKIYFGLLRVLTKRSP